MSRFSNLYDRYSASWTAFEENAFPSSQTATKAKRRNPTTTTTKAEKRAAEEKVYQSTRLDDILTRRRSECGGNNKPNSGSDASTVRYSVASEEPQKSKLEEKIGQRRPQQQQQRIRGRSSTVTRDNTIGGKQSTSLSSKSLSTVRTRRTGSVEIRARSRSSTRFSKTRSVSPKRATHTRSRSSVRVQSSSGALIGNAPIRRVKSTVAAQHRAKPNNALYRSLSVLDLSDSGNSDEQGGTGDNLGRVCSHSASSLPTTPPQGSSSMQDDKEGDMKTRARAMPKRASSATSGERKQRKSMNMSQTKRCSSRTSLRSGQQSKKKQAKVLPKRSQSTLQQPSTKLVECTKAPIRRAKSTAAAATSYQGCIDEQGNIKFDSSLTMLDWSDSSADEEDDDDGPLGCRGIHSTTCIQSNNNTKRCSKSFVVDTTANNKQQKDSALPQKSAAAAAPAAPALTTTARATSVDRKQGNNTIQVATHSTKPKKSSSTNHKELAVGKQKAKAPAKRSQSTVQPSCASSLSILASTTKAPIRRAKSTVVAAASCCTDHRPPASKKSNNKFDSSLSILDLSDSDEEENENENDDEDDAVILLVGSRSTPCVQLPSRLPFDDDNDDDNETDFASLEKETADPKQCEDNNCAKHTRTLSMDLSSKCEESPKKRVKESPIKHNKVKALPQRTRSAVLPSTTTACDPSLVVEKAPIRRAKSTAERAMKRFATSSSTSRRSAHTQGNHHGLYASLNILDLSDGSADNEDADDIISVCSHSTSCLPTAAQERRSTLLHPKKVGVSSTRTDCDDKLVKVDNKKETALPQQDAPAEVRQEQKDETSVKGTTIRRKTSAKDNDHVEQYIQDCCKKAKSKSKKKLEKKRASLGEILNGKGQPNKVPSGESVSSSKASSSSKGADCCLDTLQRMKDLSVLRQEFHKEVDTIKNNGSFALLTGVSNHKKLSRSKSDDPEIDLASKRRSSSQSSRKKSKSCDRWILSKSTNSRSSMCGSVTNDEDNEEDTTTNGDQALDERLQNLQAEWKIDTSTITAITWQRTHPVILAE